MQKKNDKNSKNVVKNYFLDSLTVSNTLEPGEHNTKYVSKRDTVSLLNEQLNTKFFSLGSTATKSLPSIEVAYALYTRSPQTLHKHYKELSDCSEFIKDLHENWNDKAEKKYYHIKDEASHKDFYIEFCANPIVIEYIENSDIFVAEAIKMLENSCMPMFKNIKHDYLANNSNAKLIVEQMSASSSDECYNTLEDGYLLHVSHEMPY